MRHHSAFNHITVTYWSSAEDNFDSYGRLTRSHAVSDPAGTPDDLVDLNYAYDDLGNPTWRYDVLQNSGLTKWSQQYTYNNLNQLATATEGAISYWGESNQSIRTVRQWGWEGSVGGDSCSMDKLGNWLTYHNNGSDDVRTYNHGSDVNAIATRTVNGGSQWSLDYDDNGNLIDNGHSYKCIYDFRNRLIEVTDQADDTVAEYYYDGLNRRTRATVYQSGGASEESDTRYIYNGGWQVIEERDENDSSALVARYVYGNEYIDEPIVMYRDGNSDDDFDDTDEVLYYLQDRLYNVVALTDVTGDIREWVYYEPYGRSTCRDTTPSEQVESHFGNPYLFTGRRLDDKTCLYQYRNRYYSASMGRFISRDPIGYDGGGNLYGYVSDNPVADFDPLGLVPGCAPVGVDKKDKPYDYTDPATTPAGDLAEAINDANGNFVGWKYPNDPTWQTYDKAGYCIMCWAGDPVKKPLPDGTIVTTYPNAFWTTKTGSCDKFKPDDCYIHKCVFPDKNKKSKYGINEYDANPAPDACESSCKDLGTHRKIYYEYTSYQDPKTGKIIKTLTIIKKKCYLVGTRFEYCKETGRWSGTPPTDPNKLPSPDQIPKP